MRINQGSWEKKQLQNEIITELKYGRISIEIISIRGLLDKKFWDSKLFEIMLQMEYIQ